MPFLSIINDIRVKAFLVLVAAIASIGFLLQQSPDSWVVGDQKNYDEFATTPTYLLDPIDKKDPVKEPIILANIDPNGHVEQQQGLQTQQHFKDAAELLRIGHHQQAITLLHKVLQRYPNLPEAHVNMGFAMLGLNDLQKAANSFAYAIELQPEFANSYYGLAMVAEQEQDWEIALSAMRTYIHLRQDDSYLAKARAALDLWQSKLNESRQNLTTR
ncbi:tetratricopeptide repeat protein [Thalassotalea aquiviva]|uniref:tetratricopeptide repeat protein n=1 Tax=Thalassotalea aquiviva TaxID=3242415 RepID=UPI00352BC8BB